MTSAVLRAALVVFALTVLSACARTIYPSPDEALRPVESLSIVDDLEVESLRLAFTRQLQLIRSRKGPAQYVFGDRSYSRAEYGRTLIDALRILEQPNARASDIAGLFDVYEAFGAPDWGEVLVTGYFQPRLKGSLRPTARHSRALYRYPAGLSTPFFTRAEIDSGNALAGRGLEICWVDPVDAFFLQIQGSGVIELDDGSELSLVYAGKNGHPYTGIGKLVWDVIPKEQLTMQRLDLHLRSLPEEDRQSILNANESYVFFEPSTEHARTALGVPATAGRTIAIDRSIYPIGAAALLEFERPPPPHSKAAKGPAVRRVVIAQDVGSAIKGSGRVDLFWGQGQESAYYAGRLRTRGRLYFLAPKSK